MNSGPNWARRYVTHHRRLCARPGCGTPAAATLRFQPTQREAWLIDLDMTVVRTEGDLCARHAAQLVLPRGWELHDERTVGRDVGEPARSAPRASSGRARRRRPKRADEALPGLAPDPDPASQPGSERQPEPTAAPRLSDPAREQLAGHLDAQTPLLRRAFQNVRPPYE